MTWYEALVRDHLVGRPTSSRAASWSSIKWDHCFGKVHCGFWDYFRIFRKWSAVVSLYRFEIISLVWSYTVEHVCVSFRIIECRASVSQWRSEIISQGEESGARHSLLFGGGACLRVGEHSLLSVGKKVRQSSIMACLCKIESLFLCSS